MASKENNALNPEVLDLKRASAVKTAQRLTAALASGNLTRSKDTPAISRHIRVLG